MLSRWAWVALLLLPVSLGLASCDATERGAAATQANAAGAWDADGISGNVSRSSSRTVAQRVPPWDAARYGDDEYSNPRMERHPELIGRPADDLIATYGKPFDETRFRAGEGVGTYSGGVASQLPGRAARNARTPVRELVWQKAGCNFIVRFRQDRGNWRVFDAFEASAEADF